MSSTDLLTALQTLPVAVRRRAPVAVLAVTGIAALAQLLIRVQSADLSTVGVLVAFFTVVAQGSRATGLVLAGLAAAGILVAKTLDRPTVFMRTDDLLFIYVQFTIAWVLGATVRRLPLRVMALERRAAQSDLELAAERARIARESTTWSATAFP